MTELEKHTATIEKLSHALFVLNRDGKLTPKQLESIRESINTSIKLLSKVVDTFDRQVKDMLDSGFTPEFNGRRYYYKVTESKRFDSQKAKKTLESLDYHIDDFYTISTRKSLNYEQNN